MRDVILTPFAPILVESTRSIGYSFEAALSDILDNSIAKSANVINVNFRFADNPYISIIDDGEGMYERELEAAMRYGSRSSLEVRDRNDLGRFGLGLKMSSLSQCRRLTVVTKKDSMINAARWDLDHIIRKGDWVLQRLEGTEIDNLQHIDILKSQSSGTIVIWENLDRMITESVQSQKIFDEKIDIARAHIGLVFHRFLETIKPIKIYFNNAKVEPVDPFLSDNPATQPLPEQDLVIDESIIKVKPYILPYASKLSGRDRKLLEGVDLKNSQGFYVYRNKRLIIWGTWFRLLKQYELNKLSRVRVDIPNTLDSIWEIDVKKSTASLPEVVKRNLVSIVENAVGRSESVFKYRGRNINSNELIHVWDHIDERGKMQYLINRELPLYKALEASIDEENLKYLNSFIKTLEDSFPYGDIYYRVAKSGNNIQPAELGFNEVYKIAVDTIESIKNINGNANAFIQNMDKYDYFLKYPDVIKAVREEYEDE